MNIRHLKVQKHIHFNHLTSQIFLYQCSKPGIEREQAFADISLSALCCHSNETRAPIADLPNSAQLGAPGLYHSWSYIRVRALVWECGEGQIHRQTHRRAWPLYISRRLRLTRNVIINMAVAIPNFVLLLYQCYKKEQRFLGDRL